MTKNGKKFTTEKNYIFLIKNYNFPIPRPEVTEEALKSGHPALQNIKFLDFFYTFVGHFSLLDPDTDSEYGSGSTDLIESGSNTDLDPKP